MLWPMRAATRWQRLVQTRLAEMEQLDPGRGAVGADYWNMRGRARRYGAAMATVTGDPLLVRLRGATNRRSTMLDVGAGTGRFALALAPRVDQVVAVDASRAMLGVLRRTARQREITNVRCVEAPWQEAVVEPADVVVCSYVLPLIAEAEPFLAKIDTACRDRAFVMMNAMSADAVVDHFWRHFHGRSRKPAPTYLDAAAILADLGAEPLVEVIEAPTRVRHADLRAAVRSYRETLVLPDTAAVRAELASLLSGWLVDDAGVLRPPLKTYPTAIISWAGRAEH